MIQMQQVMLRYPRGKTALSGANGHFKKGGFYYLIGESGAGKSSLLRMIYGGVRPSSGSLHVDGVDIRSVRQSQLRQLRRRIGIIFQDHRLLVDRSVFENVALPLRVQGWKPDRLEARVAKVLDFVGLEDRLWSYPEALSGGEQQRVAIARAMSASPPIILADEPTGNLDQDTADRVVEHLTDLNRQGTTVLVATHDLHLLERFPAQVVELHQGAIVRGLEQDSG